MFIPTKFANTWFADDQRALANTVALGSNTVGILIGSFISPQIVESSVQFVSEMCLLNLICLGISLLPTLMACFIVRSTPPLPPSYSAIISGQYHSQQRQQAAMARSSELLLDGQQEQQQAESEWRIYFNQIGKLLKSKDFLLLMCSFGVALGLFNALTTLIEQILCVRGYTDVDMGYFGGAMIVSGSENILKLNSVYAFFFI